MGQGRHTLRSTSDPVYPQTNARCSIYIAERLASEKEYLGTELTSISYCTLCNYKNMLELTSGESEGTCFCLN